MTECEMFRPWHKYTHWLTLEHTRTPRRTLENTLCDVEDEANVDTLADTLSKVQAERLGNKRQCVGQGTNGHAS